MSLAAWVVREAEVVVGAEIQHFLASHLDGSLLRSFDEAFVLVKTSLLDVFQFLLEMFLKFTVHSIM